MKLKQKFAPKGLSICIGIGTENGVNKILPPSTNLALCRLPAATGSKICGRLTLTTATLWMSGEDLSTLPHKFAA
eukprot:scaffold1014_cov142-Skeletonema_dohrnii-CCMP3373.AAC.8